MKRKSEIDAMAAQKVCRGVYIDQYGLVTSSELSSVSDKVVAAVLSVVRTGMVLSKFALADIVHFVVRYKVAQGMVESEAVSDIAERFSSPKSYVSALDSAVKVKRLYKVAHMFPNDKTYRSLDLPFSCYVQLAMDRSCRSDEKRDYIAYKVASLMKRTSKGFENVTSSEIRAWLHSHSNHVVERNNVESEFHSLRRLSAAADYLRVNHLAGLSDGKLRELVDAAGVLVDIVQVCSKRAVSAVKAGSKPASKKKSNSKKK